MDLAARKRTARVALGGWVLVALAALSSPVMTQGPGPVDVATARVAGTWDLAISDAEAQQRIESGISAGVDGLPPVVDGIAAGQLRGRLTLSRFIEVAVTRGRVLVRFDGTSYDTVPGERRAYPLAGDASETVEVVQHFTDGRLQQVFSTSRGRRWNTFVPSDDGTALMLEVVVQSGQLPAPVRYALPYVRRDARE